MIFYYKLITIICLSLLLIMSTASGYKGYVNIPTWCTLFVVVMSVGYVLGIGLKYIVGLFS